MPNASLLGLGLTVALVALAGFLVRAQLKLRQLQRRFAPIMDIEAEQRSLERQKQELGREIQAKKSAWDRSYSEALAELETLTKELDAVRDTSELQSFGVYEPHYDFAKSEDYKEQLKAVRDKQKAMVRSKTAAICYTQWSIDGSRREGQKMTRRQLKLMLRAFNGECDAAIAKVKYNNVLAIEDRIERAFEGINKLGEPNRCELTQDYLDLKRHELYLAHEYQEKRQEEREEQRQHREEMREEQKVKREIEQATKEAEKEEKRYSQHLEQARREVAEAAAEQRATLERQIAELEGKLEAAREKKERAISRAQLTKSGHVYVISNCGSFGDDVYKVGLTRRLEPFERVKELGDASVPFGFDVHAMIYSEDAPALERALHEALEEHRINLVNNRKEFFRVSLDWIERTVKERYEGKVEFIRDTEAEEFRKTLAALRSREHASGREKEEDPAPVVGARAALERRRAEWAHGD